MKTDLIVFGVLLGLLAATVGVAALPLSAGIALAAALAVAATKAALIGLYFMRLRESSARIWLVVMAAGFWLALLLVIMDDYLTR